MEVIVITTGLPNSEGDQNNLSHYPKKSILLFLSKIGSKEHSFSTSDNPTDFLPEGSYQCPPYVGIKDSGDS